MKYILQNHSIQLTNTSVDKTLFLNIKVFLNNEFHYFCTLDSVTVFLINSILTLFLMSIFFIDIFLFFIYICLTSEVKILGLTYFQV